MNDRKVIYLDDALDAVNLMTDINGFCDGYAVSRKGVCITLKQLPPAQPERKPGRWIPQNHNKVNGMTSTAVYYYPKCSVCGCCANYTNFCPGCGADMRGEQDE